MIKLIKKFLHDLREEDRIDKTFYRYTYNVTFITGEVRLVADSRFTLFKWESHVNFDIYGKESILIHGGERYNTKNILKIKLISYETIERVYYNWREVPYYIYKEELLENEQISIHNVQPKA